MDFVLDPNFVLFPTSLVLVVLTACLISRHHGSPVYVAYAGRPPAVPEEIAPKVPEVVALPVGIRAVPRGDETRYMPDFHALPALVVEPDPVEVSVAQELLEENVALRSRVAWLQSTKKRALGRAAVNQERVRVILTEVMSRPRRAPKSTLAAEVIEIGSRRAPLVPPAIARAWDEESA